MCDNAKKNKVLIIGENKPSLLKLRETLIQRYFFTDNYGLSEAEIKIVFEKEDNN